MILKKTNRLGQRGLLACCLIFTLGPALAADDAVVADEDRVVAELISRLGDAKFAERENASEDLIRIGLAALPALERALEHPDREIRYRCRRVISVVKENDFQRRLLAFASNRDGEDDYDLPAWSAFKEQFGGDGEARGLFVEMQKAEPQALLALEEGAKSASNLLTNRTQELVNETRILRQDLPLGSVATMLFLAADEHVPMNQQSSSSLYSLCYQQNFRTAIQAGTKKDLLRGLLGAWIRRDQDWTAYQGMALAMQYDLKDGLVPALRLLENNVAQLHVRQYSILTIAKFGDESHVPVLEKLLDDETVSSKRKEKNVEFVTQIRDVALAALVTLTKQNPKDYGLDRLQPHPTVVFNTGTVGFENDEQRAAAHQKWKGYKASRK